KALQEIAAAVAEHKDFQLWIALKPGKLWIQRERVAHLERSLRALGLKRRRFKVFPAEKAPEGDWWGESSEVWVRLVRRGGG
ncbi:MAG: hypothetical protein D6765_02495, partial [Bacteroidetes bacterium]